MTVQTGIVQITESPVISGESMVGREISHCQIKAKKEFGLGLKTPPEKLRSCIRAILAPFEGSSLHDIRTYHEAPPFESSITSHTALSVQHLALCKGHSNSIQTVEPLS